MKFIIAYHKKLVYLVLGAFFISVVINSIILSVIDANIYAITQTSSANVRLLNLATICGCGYAGCDCNQLTPRVSPTPYWKFTPTWINTPVKPTWTFTYVTPSPVAIWTFPATRLIPNTPLRLPTSTIPFPKPSWTFQPAPTFLKTSTAVVVTQPATILIPTFTPLPTRTPTRTGTRIPTGTPIPRTATPLPTNTAIIPSGIRTQDALSILSNNPAASTQVANVFLTQVACQYSTACLTQSAVNYANYSATLSANATNYANNQATMQAIATFTPSYVPTSVNATTLANVQATGTAAAFSTQWAINPYTCLSFYYVYCYTIYVNPNQTDNYYCNYVISIARSSGRGQNGECIIPIWIHPTPAFFTPTPTITPSLIPTPTP